MAQHIEDLRYEIGEWDSPEINKSNLVEVLARVSDLEVAFAAFTSAHRKWPQKHLILRERMRVIRKAGPGYGQAE